MKLNTYGFSEMRKELRRELVMRRKVWQRVPGMAESFVSMEHQKKYDVLKQLSEILEYTKPAVFYVVLKSAETNQANQQRNLEEPSNLFTT